MNLFANLVESITHKKAKIEKAKIEKLKLEISEIAKKMKNTTDEEIFSKLKFEIEMKNNTLDRIMFNYGMS